MGELGGVEDCSESGGGKQKKQRLKLGLDNSNFLL